MFRFMHTKLPEFIKKMYVAVHDDAAESRAVPPKPFRQ